MKDLYFFITIIRRADHEEYERFFRENKIAHFYSVNCNGTVHKKILTCSESSGPRKPCLFLL